MFAVRNSDAVGTSGRMNKGGGGENGNSPSANCKFCT